MLNYRLPALNSPSFDGPTFYLSCYLMFILVRQSSYIKTFHHSAAVLNRILCLRSWGNMAFHQSAPWPQLKRHIQCNTQEGWEARTLAGRLQGTNKASNHAEPDTKPSRPSPIDPQVRSSDEGIGKQFPPFCYHETEKLMDIMIPIQATTLYKIKALIRLLLLSH